MGNPKFILLALTSFILFAIFYLQFDHFVAWQQSRETTVSNMKLASQEKELADRMKTVEQFLQDMTKTLSVINSREEAMKDTNALINEASNKIMQGYAKDQEDAYQKVCGQLWKSQETRSRENHERQKKDHPRKAEVDNSKKPSGSDIVLLWGYTKNYPDKYPREIFDQLKHNRETYCKTHGYINMGVLFDDYVNDDNKDSAKAWLKVYAIKDAFNKHPNAKWVFWLDVDAIIMDENLDVASHILDPEALKSIVCYDSPIAERGKKYKGKFSPSKDKFNPDEIELVAAQDEWFLNAGVLLIKNTKFMRDIVEKDWLTKENLKRDLVFAEQDVLNDLIMNNQELRKRWAIIPQWAINAYDSSYRFQPAHWQPGDFIAHFPGNSGNGKYPDIWKRYWEQRTPAVSGDVFY